MQANARTLRRLNTLLHPLGLHLTTRDASEQGFVLNQYLRPDGGFDYARYKAVQTAGNRRKIDQVFATETNIDMLAAYLRRKLARVDKGLCHGTRRGVEQAWFAERLPGCEVWGTEISDTADQFPNTIQWDFHEVKPEWLGAKDFIYSNSLDHAYDPEKALNAWMSCLRPGGLALLEHTDLHGASAATELDPFGADLAVMPYLIARWAKGRYALVDLLAAPADAKTHTHFLCLQRLEGA